MRLLMTWSWVVALLAVGIGACAEVNNPTDVAPVMVTVVSYAGAQKPLADVEICETDTNNCELTDADGKATLYLPIGEETSFTRRKSGFAQYLTPIVVPAMGVALRLSLSSDERIAEQHGNVMSTYPMRDTGTIVFSVLPNAAGATIALSGATGTTFYTDDDLDWSLDLSSTASVGAGGFTDVSPGDDYRIEIAGNPIGEPCTVEKGWPGPFDNSVRLLVREGFLSDVTMVCP